MIVRWGSLISGLAPADFETLSKLLNVINGLDGFEAQLLEGICEYGCWPAFLNSFVNKPFARSDSVTEKGSLELEASADPPVALSAVV